MAPFSWFRLYSEWADDPKVQMMPEPMQRRLVMLFCNRCKNETLHETEREFHWRISAQELAQTKALFMEKGFIDENWNLLNWNKRQFISDSSTERVRRHRLAKKHSGAFHETAETELQHQWPATETAPDTEPDLNTQEQENNLRAHCAPTAKPKFPSESSPIVEAIYRAYPRHDAPRDAKKAIVAAIKRIYPAHDTEWLLERVRTYLTQRKGQDPQYTPMPATWFNRGSYDDESLKLRLHSADGASYAAKVQQIMQEQGASHAARN